jgi:hypothetical protein
MKLTAKQEKFCQNILAGMSQADAYRNSFNVKTNTKAATIQDSASKLMANPLVSQRVIDLRKPVIAKIQLTREWVLEQLIENVSMGKALEPIVSKDGQTSGEVKQNLPAANKALELLGKEIGMFTDRTELTGANGGPLEIAKIERVIVDPK